MEREVIQAAMSLDDELRYVGENVVEETPASKEETSDGAKSGEDAYAEYLRCFGYSDT